MVPEKSPVSQLPTSISPPGSDTKPRAGTESPRATGSSNSIDTTGWVAPSSPMRSRPGSSSESALTNTMVPSVTLPSPLAASPPLSSSYTYDSAPVGQSVGGSSPSSPPQAQSAAAHSTKIPPR